MAFVPERDVALAPKTTWRIGGPAAFYAAPMTVEALVEAVQWARTEGLPLTLLGRGSNTLVADAGLPGLTLSTRDMGRGEPVVEADSFVVPAGILLPKLAKFAAEKGFTGYEFYIGIPGTVGGAVFMNAGFGPSDERQTANRCTDVQLLEADGAIRWVPYGDLGPRYRHTALMEMERPAVILAARFRVGEAAMPETIRANTDAHLAMRRERQPFARPTAGSVFKATAEGTPAAVYIDQLGLKGSRCGGAVVSPKHANWIENDGGARAEDVRQLMRSVQEAVRANFAVWLEPEVRFLG